MAGWRLSQTSSEVEDNGTSSNTADDMGQSASETNWQSCKEVPKVTKGLF